MQPALSPGGGGPRQKWLGHFVRRYKNTDRGGRGLWHHHRGWRQTQRVECTVLRLAPDQSLTAWRRVWTAGDVPDWNEDVRGRHERHEGWGWRVRGAGTAVLRRSSEVSGENSGGGGGVEEGRRGALPMR